MLIGKRNTDSRVHIRSEDGERMSWEPSEEYTEGMFYSQSLIISDAIENMLTITKNDLNRVMSDLVSHVHMLSLHATVVTDDLSTLELCKKINALIEEYNSKKKVKE